MTSPCLSIGRRGPVYRKERACLSKGEGLSIGRRGAADKLALTLFEC
jgi:hypothetical protein